MNRVPLAADSAQTVGAVTDSAVEYALPDGYQGELLVEVSGQLSGDPTTCYGWTNRVTVSCEAGAATVQGTGVAVVLDPAVCGCAVVVNASGTSIRARVTGVAAETWNWTGKMSGLLHVR